MRTRLTTLFLMIAGGAAAFLHQAVVPPVKLAFASTNAVSPTPLQEVCSLAAPQLPDPDFLPLSGLERQAALEKYGWSMLHALVDGGNQIASTPRWEKWATKMDVGIEPTTGQTPEKGFELSNKELTPDQSKRLIRSLQAPRQAALDASHKPPGSEPQLSSVFYNCAAGTAIQTIVQSHPAGASIPNLPAGSVVAKAIWVALNLVHPPVFQASKYSVDVNPQPPVDRRLARLSERHPDLADLYTHMTNPYLGNPTPKYWETIELNIDGDGCEITSAPGKAARCLHSYNISANTKAIEQFKINPKLLTSGCLTKCVAVLAGLQLMVRPQTDARWVWIALWWTGIDNGQNLPAPWNLYEMNVTDQPRGQLQPDGSRNIIFNPYLEGIDDPNGVVSNCANCHTYAAFQQKERGAVTSLVLDGAGIHQGDLPIGQLEPKGVQPGTTPTAAVLYGLPNVVLTDSLWSIADSKTPTSGTASDSGRHN